MAARQASLSITNSQTLLKLMPIKTVIPSSHLIPCHPLLLLPPISPSIRVFSNESTLCMRWPKYWSFSFSISPSNEHPGLTSFKMDWLDLLAVQGTLKSLLQEHSSKVSILQCSSFFTVQLSYPYMRIMRIMRIILSKISQTKINDIYYIIPLISSSKLGFFFKEECKPHEAKNTADRTRKDCSFLANLIASPGSMHETGCSGLVHWDDPERWDGEGGGRGVS